MPFPKSQKKMHRFLSLWFCPIFYPDGAAGVLGQIIFIQTPEFSITDFFFASKMQIFPRRALWSCACFWHLRGESWNKRIYIYIIINFIYRTKNSVTCSESCVQILTWALWSSGLVPIRNPASAPILPNSQRFSPLFLSESDNSSSQGSCKGIDSDNQIAAKKNLKVLLHYRHLATLQSEIKIQKEEQD